MDGKEIMCRVYEINEAAYTTLELLAANLNEMEPGKACAVVGGQVRELKRALAMMEEMEA